MKRKILNVGCGLETYGTDFIDFYPSNPKVIKCDVDKERFPYSNNSFDEVYSRNLIEHTSNPIHVLQEMKRVLKKSGKLIIITDNAGFLLYYIPLFEHIFAQHNKNKYRYGKKDRHYFIFTPLHLRNLLQKVGGFRISISYYYRNVNKGFNFMQPFVRIVKGTFLESMSHPFLTVVAYKK
jgi:ubiquinone/menaquinone biosynthesis C-methylase UbiE